MGEMEKLKTYVSNLIFKYTYDIKTYFDVDFQIEDANKKVLTETITCNGLSLLEFKDQLVVLLRELEDSAIGSCENAKLLIIGLERLKQDLFLDTQFTGTINHKEKLNKGDLERNIGLDLPGISLEKHIINHSPEVFITQIHKAISKFTLPQAVR